ncbi:MAG: septation protein IspZ [Chromatiaceae bacterium]|nr:septation protein IspZ [Chromatiaceae bacterium]
MKLLIDFLPVLLFFIAYKLAGIYVATGVAIAASAAQIGWSWIRQRRVETLPLVTLGLLVVLGGLTIALRDPIFVMWKPTLVNWLFAGAFLATQFIGQRTLAERMLGGAVRVEPPIWRRLNLLWGGFFLLLGAINLFVVYVASGYFSAHQALLAASALPGVDLNQCASLFSGATLELCERARASEGIWVNFKLFGMMGLTLLFVIGQAVYLARHMEDEPDPQEAR